jgi:valyl-tRNA synthetase
VLGHVLENILKLAHPFAPFVTETIWQTLYSDTDSLLITAGWPKAHKSSADQAAAFESLRAIVVEARGLVKALGLNRPSLYYHDVPFLAENASLLERLSGLGKVAEVDSGTGLQLTNTQYRCWLDVDMTTLHAYRDKLAEQAEAQEQVITQLEGRLSNKRYVDNAPKQIVQQTRDQLEEAKASLERLKTEQARFSN